MKSIRKRKGALTLAITAIVLSIGISAVQAAGDHKHGHGEKHAADIGSAGSRTDASRTITIEMYDNYFEPKTLDIEEGETVRFVVVNKGEFVHEFNIATAKMHLAHQKEMMAMMENGMLEIDRIRHDKMDHDDGPGMKHDHANSALLEPGQTGELVWKFDTHAKLEFACNVPGHYQSGMAGPIGLSH